MGLLGKMLGYERTLTEAKNSLLLKDERIGRLITERASLLETNQKAHLRIGRLALQLRRLGQEPTK